MAVEIWRYLREKKKTVPKVKMILKNFLYIVCKQKVTLDTTLQHLFTLLRLNNC